MDDKYIQLICIYLALITVIVKYAKGQDKT